MVSSFVTGRLVDSLPHIATLASRAVDLHSFYADPHPAVFLNADPDPGPGPASPTLKKKNHEEFS